MAVQIQLRRDTASNWSTYNPVLADGELGISLDTKQIKLGDGVTVWDSLSYFIGSSGESNTASNVGTTGIGVFKQKTGVDLEFKKINAGSSKVTITDDVANSEVDVDVVESNIVHQNLSGAGTNTHAQIDTHISDTSNPHSVTAAQVGAVSSGTGTINKLAKFTSTDVIGDSSITDTGSLVNITSNGPFEVDSTSCHISVDGNIFLDIDANDEALDAVFIRSGSSENNIFKFQDNGKFYAYNLNNPSHPGAYKSLFIDTTTREIYYQDVPAGEINTASNIGTAGVGVFKQKTDVDLEFKRINAGSSKVTITDDTGNDEIDIDIVESNITHDNISGSGTNTHAQIDTHISDSTVHFTEGSIDHTAISNIGTNSHAQIDTHISDSTIHFTEGSIDHTAITNIGTNSHATIDTHLASTSNPHTVTAAQVGNSTAQWNADKIKDVPVDDSAKSDGRVLVYRSGTGNLEYEDQPGSGGGEANTASNSGTAGVGVWARKTGVDLEFKNINAGSSKVTVTDDTVNDEIDIDISEANIVHGNLSGSGTNTHAQIDTHIGDSTTHFTEASIDHTAISNIGTNSHSQIDTHIGDSTIHFTEGAIDHTAITNIGTNSHADIDNHISNFNNPHSVDKSDVGLSNVDNTSDINKPISTAVQSSLDSKSDTTHDHSGIYELAFSKNTGFNKDFGTSAGTVSEGNHTHSNPKQTKSITVESPTGSEDICMFCVPENITITNVYAVVKGTSPSVTINPVQTTDRSAAGTAILSSATAITNTTSGQNLTSFNDATVPSGSWIVFKTTAQSGTVDEITMSIAYSVD